jgi:hypothetical protein
MDEVSTSETSVNSYPTTQCNIAEGKSCFVVWEPEVSQTLAINERWVKRCDKQVCQQNDPYATKNRLHLYFLPFTGWSPELSGHTGGECPQKFTAELQLSVFPFPTGYYKVMAECGWLTEVFITHRGTSYLVFLQHSMRFLQVSYDASQHYVFDDGVGPFFGPCNMTIWLIFCAPLSIQSANSPRLQKKCIILFGGNSR